MADSDRSRLTPAAGRRFGLTLAVGFAAIGAVFAWRGHYAAARICWTIAALCAAAGVLIPTHLGPVERAWTAFGVALSHVVRPVFFSVLYFAVITPAGLVRRSVGRSPLARDRNEDGFWRRRELRDPEAARRSLERQF